MTYYPNRRFAARMMEIHRRAILPEETVSKVLVEREDRVDVRDTVARGLLPAKHFIIDAAAELGLRNPEELQQRLEVKRNQRVEAGQVLVKRGGRRNNIKSPIEGIVVGIDSGRIVLQEIPERVSVEAGLRGQVIEILGTRGVIIRGTGAVLQGVWGNGRNVIGTIRMEPEDGITSVNPDALDSSYRGEIIITREPLHEGMFFVGEARAFGGLIAPSMDASLLDRVQALPYPVMLTEGFGEIAMSLTIETILTELNGQQGALNAVTPQRFDSRRPELVANRNPQGATPRKPGAVALATGMEVRITRAPYFGLLATVTALPGWQRLANGLRIEVANVRLPDDEIVPVPLENLELVGT